MTTFNIEQDGTRCTVIWRHFSWSVLFLLLWLSIWTVGCVMLVRLVFIEGQFVAIFFALPFWGAWIFVTGWTLNVLFGKTRIRLDENGCESEWTCLFVKRNKRIELDDLRRFEIHSRQGSKGSRTYSLRIVRSGENADFSVPTGGTPLEALCDRLNDVLKRLKAEHRSTATEETEPLETSTKKSVLPEPIVFGLDSTPRDLEPPGQSRWRYQTDFDGFGFRKQGKVKPTDLFGSLFGAIFWNGIVSVFLLQLFGVINPANRPEGGSWWFMFFFLVPFVLIGLAIIGAAASNILELFRVTSWTFSYGEAKYRNTRLGPARIETIPLTGWSALVVRIPDWDDEDEEDEEESEEDVEEMREFYETCAFWQLAFLDAADEELLAVDGLSKGEALWMADVILREKRSIR